MVLVWVMHGSRCSWKASFKVSVLCWPPRLGTNFSFSSTFCLFLFPNLSSLWTLFAPPSHPLPLVFLEMSECFSVLTSKSTDCISLLDCLILERDSVMWTCSSHLCSRGVWWWVGRKKSVQEEVEWLLNRGWNLLVVALGTSWRMRSVSSVSINSSPEEDWIASSSAVMTAREIMEATCHLFPSQSLWVSRSHLAGGLHCCSFNPTSSWAKLPYLLWVQHVKGRTSLDTHCSVALLILIEGGRDQSLMPVPWAVLLSYSFEFTPGGTNWV